MTNNQMRALVRGDKIRVVGFDPFYDGCEVAVEGHYKQDTYCLSTNSYEPTIVTEPIAKRCECCKQVPRAMKLGLFAHNVELVERSG